jgi:hypothetical protein
MDPFLFLWVDWTVLGGSPCYHSMAHLRVADGEKPPAMESSCKYIE